jgi:hypothetical protein
MPLGLDDTDFSVILSLFPLFMPRQYVTELTQATSVDRGWRDDGFPFALLKTEVDAVNCLIVGIKTKWISIAEAHDLTFVLFRFKDEILYLLSCARYTTGEVDIREELRASLREAASNNGAVVAWPNTKVPFPLNYVCEKCFGGVGKCFDDTVGLATNDFDAFMSNKQAREGFHQLFLTLRLAVAARR